MKEKMTDRNKKAKPVIRGIIFDLDGVLVDSEDLHARAWADVLTNRGVRPPDDIETRFIGVTDTYTGELLRDEFGLEGNSAELVEEKRRLYRKLAEGELRSFPGLREELKSLSLFPGLRLGVATSSRKNEAALMLKSAGLEEFFRVVVTADDVDKVKPDPECYLTACSRIGVHPGESAAVEDSSAGVTSARRAGLYTVAVITTTPEEKLKEADAVLPSTLDAVKLLADYHENSETRSAWSCCG
jgi:HAD superfamily hydrolase (TIGR01509 family)